MWTLHWPWRARGSGERLVIDSSAEHFAYAVAGTDGRLRRCGVEQRGGDDEAAFARRVRALGLPAHGVCAVLPLAGAQLIQIEAPAVHADEVKAAARWRIKDQVEGRLADMTLDVMVVGGDEPRKNRQLFVAVAPNASITTIAERTRAAGLELAVVDIAETAQRNLQSALAAAEGLAQRATAALVRHAERCLLTICVDGELYDARRLDDGGHVVDTPAVATPAPLPAFDGDLHSADFVDYGAEPEAGAVAGDAPRLVIEMQRSFDVWERSWPDLPLAALWVQVGAASPALAAQLQETLGVRCGIFDPEEVFPGFGQAAATPELQAQLLPILGALLRADTLRP